MKILYFSQRYSLHDYNFLKKMGESHHSIIFLPLQQSLTDEKRSIPKGVRKIPWPKNTPKNGEISLLNLFNQIILETGPDLIHAGPVQTCGYLTALSSFHPFVLMSWGSDILLEMDQNPQSIEITKFTLEHSDWLLVDNHAVKEKIQAEVQYPDERILEFPWGVDLTQFHKISGVSRIRKLLEWEDFFVVLSTRMWEPVYGIFDLLEGFYHAYQEKKNIRLFLLGDGSLAPEIHKFIRDRNLGDVIKMPGIVNHEELPEYFHAADIYISCSISDGSSISLLEAMATGLPPIVTRIPGNIQWIQNRENGWLIPPGEPEAVAQTIRSVADAKESILAKIAEKNIEMIKKSADWNKNINKLLDLYDYIEERND
jgi:L-malate glycosyltransferase